MNRIDRVLAAMFGSTAPAPQRRHYEAAGAGGRWPGTSYMSAPASSAHAAGPIAGSRIAYLAANSPHGASIVNAIVTNVVADGPAFRPNVRGAAMSAAYLTRFWPTVDVEGSDLGHFLQRIVRCLVIYGEAFVVLATDPDDGSARAQLIGVEQVDRTATRELADGGRITAGIEQDAIGRIVAYHVLPDNHDAPFAQQRPAVRIPASDVLHLFDAQWPGQRRGISWLASIATRLAEISRLEDAQLATAATQALVGLVFTTMGGDFSGLPDGTNPQVPAMEPGASIVAPPGFDVKAFQAARMDGANDFLKAMLRSAATGAGIPYALMTGDLSDTNYSSARLGLLEFRRRVIAIQKNLLIPRILDPLWTRWATLEQLAGRLPRGDVSGTWQFTGWQALDPAKEAAADAASIASGTRSRFEIIAARGRDPQEVDAEIAADTFTPRVANAS